MWVRGLKLKIRLVILLALLVAPYVGAWIETIISVCGKSALTSHPMWVRGLKQHGKGKPSDWASRTLCGCVD